LQRRYRQLVREHLDAPSRAAHGLKAAPGTAEAFASTQAAWRFFANPRVTLPALVEPLRTAGREAAAASPSAYVLLVHDWSKLDDRGHRSKTDQTRLSHAEDIGYELTTALLVDATTGAPLAPMELSLRCASGLLTTAQTEVVAPRHHLEQLLPVMQASRGWSLPQSVVHVIDREADSQTHFRQWIADEHTFLVRADATRKVRWQGQLLRLPELSEALLAAGQFVATGTVPIRGRTGCRWVAEADVLLDRPARQRTPQGRVKVGRKPLPLRLVISRIVNDAGRVLAEWWLLTNVAADVPPATVADWYYWRWQIESFHKLLKSSGQQLESWQQESAEAIARRLLISAMACVCAWTLERQTTPAAVECQRLLVRLSGRQMKRSRPVTTSALLAGLHVLVPMLELLEHYTPDQLRQLARTAIPRLHRSG